MALGPQKSIFRGLTFPKSFWMGFSVLYHIPEGADLTKSLPTLIPGMNWHKGRRTVGVACVGNSPFLRCLLCLLGVQGGPVALGPKRAFSGASPSKKLWMGFLFYTIFLKGQIWPLFWSPFGARNLNVGSLFFPGRPRVPLLEALTPHWAARGWGKPIRMPRTSIQKKIYVLLIKKECVLKHSRKKQILSSSGMSKPYP